MSYRPTHLLTVSYDLLGQLKMLSFINKKFAERRECYNTHLLRILLLRLFTLRNNKFLVSHEFSRPVLPTKHPSLSFGCFVGKIGLWNP